MSECLHPDVTFDGSWTVCKWCGKHMEPDEKESISIPRQLFEELTSAAIELEENLENICQQPNFGTLKQLSATVEAAVKIRDATATP